MFCIQCSAASDASQANAPTAHMRASDISQVVATAPSPGTPVGSTTSQTDALIETVRAATLGEYEVMTELGRGGMAAVFLAHEIALDRKVAIKVVLPALEQLSPGIAERFLREARTAAAMSHPHVVPVYAVKQTSNLVYFVMKYVRGRTLESLIEDVGPIPAPIIRTILRQVGSALDYAHRNGVIHRDIKPANIILDKEGWAVVTDFGIAKVVEAEALTMTGATIGTPQYMSPEQCAGLDVTGASDQYSLGIVAYEMITGRPPFNDKSPLTMMYEHCHTPIPPIADTIPDCPPELADAVMRMLDKEPANRWPTIEDAVTAFGAASDSEQQLVRTQILQLAKRGSTSALLEKFRTPVSPAPRSRSAPRRTSRAWSTGGSRTRRLVLFGLPAAVIVVGGAVGLGLMMGRSGTPAEETAPPPAARAPILAALDLAVTPASIEVGRTLQLSASGRDAAGDAVPVPNLTWEVDNPTVASVTPTGLLTGIGDGMVRVTARSDGQSATATLGIVGRARRAPTAAARAAAAPRPVASMAVQPASATVEVGQSVALSATLRADNGATLTDRNVLWTTDAPDVATVTPAGVVTGVSVGTARISITSEGQRVTIGIWVTPIPVVAVTVTPNRQTLTVGAVVGLTATARDAAGAPLPAGPVRWASSDAAVATVSPDGRVTAVGAGRARVTATSGGVSGSATIEVTAPARPVAAAPPDARAASERILRAYGHALESRDVSRVRQAYPGLTADQARAWERFFGTVSELEVAHEILDLRAGDSTATVRVRATHRYRAARAEDRTFQFTATLRLVGGRWQLAAIE